MCLWKPILGTGNPHLITTHLQCYTCAQNVLLKESIKTDNCCFIPMIREVGGSGRRLNGIRTRSDLPSDWGATARGERSKGGTPMWSRVEMLAQYMAQSLLASPQTEAVA